MLPDTLEVASCRGLNLQANVTVEVVLHLLGSMLWPTFKYFVFSKIKRKNKDEGVTNSWKDTERMFGGLFVLNIVKTKKTKKKKKLPKNWWSPNGIPSARRCLVYLNPLWI